MKIYSVGFSYGSYSDRNSGEICSFKDINEAEEYKTRLEKIELDIRTVKNMLAVFNDSDDKSEKDLIEKAIEFSIQKIDNEKLRDFFIGSIAKYSNCFTYREEVDFWITEINLFENANEACDDESFLNRNWIQF